MQLNVIRLRFGNTPLHLGRGSEELDRTEVIYHSDSLKSAIYSVGLEMFREWQDAGEFFNGFKISSCFPFAGQELFLPKPMNGKRILFNGEPEETMPKKVKKVEFLSLDCLLKYLDQGTNALEVEKGHVSDDGAFICKEKETLTNLKAGPGRKGVFYTTGIQQRVRVPGPEMNEDAVPFYIDRIYFNEGCGLYFLARFTNETIRNQVLEALRMLGGMGIGTDRTVGNGHFVFDPERDCAMLTLSEPISSDYQMSLGLYLPIPDELGQIELKESSWNLLKRGGFIAGSSNEARRHLRKKSIYMFGEGSVFKTNKVLSGTRADLAPEWHEPIHPVWRCGMPLFLNF